MAHGNYTWIPARQYLSRLSEGCRVADIGGRVGDEWHLDNATVIGWEGDIKVDLDNFTDTSWLDGIDFAHSRHTLEDLANPERLIKAMQQVPSGWIECPSPLAEITKSGVDGLMGYLHHRWIVGTKLGALILIPKYPVLCEIQVEVFKWATDLLVYPIHWNSYYQWSPGQPPKYCVLKHGVDFDLNDTNAYMELIFDLVESTISDNQSKPFYEPAPQEAIA